MLLNMASRQLAVPHRYFSATGQQFNNHTNYLYLETMRETDTTARNLFLKVQSDDELRKSPDKPFQVLHDGSIANKELRLCSCI